MNPFVYHRANNLTQAIQLGSRPNAKFLGAGTNLVDLMRESIERPAELIDVTYLASLIERRENGNLFIGAATRNSELAGHHIVRKHYPVLARAILSGASAQIRNMATVAGNILQRTRCSYFYDDSARCNKRSNGQGCDALEGFNRNHAILGSSSECIATHPSDMCVALTALDALVHLEGAAGKRSLPLSELHCLPGETPDLETVLLPGELITGLELPQLPSSARSAYRKVRDRASYAFALISVAAVLKVESGIVTHVRLALGGVAPKPWRAERAELYLMGAPATAQSFRVALEAELAEAKPLRENGFKVELAVRTGIAVLSGLAESSE